LRRRVRVADAWPRGQRDECDGRRAEWMADYAMSEELVHLEVSRGVATITLDSPHNRNALSRQLIADLDRQLTAALHDAGARVIVLTGVGPAFCSGADLKERRGSGAAPPSGRPGGLVPILTAMWEAPKPIVGRINGPARAGGVGLVGACDIAVA